MDESVVNNNVIKADLTFLLKSISILREKIETRKAGDEDFSMLQTTCTRRHPVC